VHPPKSGSYIDPKYTNTDTEINVCRQDIFTKTNALYYLHQRCDLSWASCDSF